MMNPTFSIHLPPHNVPCHIDRVLGSLCCGSILGSARRTMERAVRMLFMSCDDAVGADVQAESRPLEDCWRGGYTAFCFSISGYHARTFALKTSTEHFVVQGGGRIEQHSGGTHFHIDLLRSLYCPATV